MKLLILFFLSLTIFSANSNNKHGQEALGNSPEITYVESSGIPNSTKTKIETVVSNAENKLRFFFPDIPTKIINKVEFVDWD
jgi:hypothetical protein